MAIILNKQNHFVAFDNLAKKNHEWITYWSMLSVINRVELNFIQKLELLAFYMMLKNKYYLSSLSKKKKKQNLNLQMGSQITNERWRRCLLWIVITMTRKRVKVISSKNISWVIRSTKNGRYQHFAVVYIRLVICNSANITIFWKYADMYSKTTKL